MAEAAACANLGAKLQQGEEKPQFEYVHAKFQYARQGSLGRSSSYEKIESERHNTGTGGEGAGAPLQNANKGQQWGPAVLVALLAGAVLLFASVYQNVGPDNGDIKVFLKQTTTQNDSEPLSMTSSQQTFVEQHQFGCFEMFTVKEIQHVKYTVDSTCPDVPQPMREVIVKKLRDEHKTRDQSFGQNVDYLANDETGEAMGYQLQYSRMPFGEEYRIILVVAGIRMVEPKQYETEKNKLCNDTATVIPGWFGRSSTVKKQECHEIYMKKVIETATPGLTKENVTMVVEQLAKNIMEQTVIPRLSTFIDL